LGSGHIHKGSPRSNLGAELAGGWPKTADDPSTQRAAA
jgi:hypothetical protein